MHIKLTVLGCGTSTGVPVPGCKCAVCTSADPRNNRLRTSALITIDHKFNILIDSSPDLRQQSLKYRIDHIDAVLYTHGHADHILGFDDLRSFNFISRQAIPCWATPKTLSSLRKAFSYIFSPDPNYKGGILTQISVNEFEAGQKIKIGPLDIQTFRLPHGDFEVSGFRFGNIGYVTDAKSIPEAAKQYLKGLKYLILNSLRYEPHHTHLTIPESVALAQELGAEQTYFVHMSHEVDYAEVNAKLPQGIELAYDGLVLEGCAVRLTLDSKI